MGTNFFMFIQQFAFTYTWLWTEQLRQTIIMATKSHRRKEQWLF